LDRSRQQARARRHVLGVGAAFDFVGGNRGRAPVFRQQLGLEWTHRLATDPKRLWKRYLVSNSRFLVLAFVELTTHVVLPED
jgi:N-acetylglucosaminyldiphosphoundecaprenol N-acetyl-beta-D-mannosaminyltransferase